ncbi:hypothetical protein GGTG_04752 [Gaeumannomyces tritici R3-111a-1]|uniref:Uncharacterized protein n=1 Tax=Gaeumannomyces tritici (strain R3-111a-1) TaxID=644352 RepID=J3NU03_GAET3|nr:hypothetical protein GGTG_04752 [Gaeumannomyces tritici R3-111a-1]EJT79668.1 hypothetical protein GGTG_04752 [Gaeumannomyces tritici R3-111a-1]
MIRLIAVGIVSINFDDHCLHQSLPKIEELAPYRHLVEAVNRVLRWTEELAPYRHLVEAANCILRWTEERPPHMFPKVHKLFIRLGGFPNGTRVLIDYLMVEAVNCVFRWTEERPPHMFPKVHKLFIRLGGFPNGTRVLIDYLMVEARSAWKAAEIESHWRKANGLEGVTPETESPGREGVGRSPASIFPPPVFTQKKPKQRDFDFNSSNLVDLYQLLNSPYRDWVDMRY